MTFEVKWSIYCHISIDKYNNFFTLKLRFIIKLLKKGSKYLIIIKKNSKKLNNFIMTKHEIMKVNFVLHNTCLET